MYASRLDGLPDSPLWKSNVERHKRMAEKLENGQVAQRSNLSLRIERYMNDRGVNPSKLRKAVNEILDRPVSSRAIKYLVTEISVESPTEVRGETIDLLDAVAKVLQTTTSDLFKPHSLDLMPKQSSPEPMASDKQFDEYISRMRVALDGPKATFFKDALDLAFIAAIGSKKNY